MLRRRPSLRTAIASTKPMNRRFHLSAQIAGFALVLTALYGCACLQAPTSGKGVNADGASRPAAGEELGYGVFPLTADMKPGTYGEAFDEAALFQGCDIVDGVDYCAFHANGWKYYAYRSGPTPEAILDKLELLPMNTPVIIHGDTIVMGDITMEMALRGVEINHSGDAYAVLRARLQGRWQSLDDPLSEFEIMGSEWRSVYNGQFMGLDFLRIVSQCAEAPPEAGPLLLRTDPEDRDAPLCYGIQFSGDNTLELVYMGRGNTLSYRRLIFTQP